MSRYGAYRAYLHELWLTRPRVWIILQGLISGVSFAVIGLLTSASAPRVVFIWACVMVTIVSAQRWRGVRARK